MDSQRETNQGSRVVCFWRQELSWEVMVFLGRVGRGVLERVYAAAMVITTKGKGREPRTAREEGGRKTDDEGEEEEWFWVFLKKQNEEG